MKEPDSPAALHEMLIDLVSGDEHWDMNPTVTALDFMGKVTLMVLTGEHPAEMVGPAIRSLNQKFPVKCFSLYLEGWGTKYGPSGQIGNERVETKIVSTVAGDYERTSMYTVGAAEWEHIDTVAQQSRIGEVLHELNREIIQPNMARNGET